VFSKELARFGALETEVSTWSWLVSRSGPRAGLMFGKDLMRFGAIDARLLPSRSGLTAGLVFGRGLVVTS
jgi:hypothetical protein